MNDQNTGSGSLQEVKDIKRILERSSRFLSLSGLSGVAAGLCALAGAWIAGDMLQKTGDTGIYDPFKKASWDGLAIRLYGLAAGVFAVAFLLSLYMTWRKARQKKLPVWDYTSKKVFWNMIIPLVAGGIFILGMLHYNEIRFVAPACLIFYGLALINASKYTLTDIRYLGCLEILTGLLNMCWLGYGLYFWALGFGVLHIIYGIIMWYKYDRKYND